MPKKSYTFEEFDNGVKAAYSLGKIEGENGKHEQLEEMQVQLRNMLTTNKELFKTIATDDKRDRVGKIAISLIVARNIMDSLFHGKKNPSCHRQLQLQYREITGKLFSSGKKCRKLKAN